MIELANITEVFAKENSDTLLAAAHQFEPLCILKTLVQSRGGCQQIDMTPDTVFETRGYVIVLLFVADCLTH